MKGCERGEKKGDKINIYFSVDLASSILVRISAGSRLTLITVCGRSLRLQLLFNILPTYLLRIVIRKSISCKSLGCLTTTTMGFATVFLGDSSPTPLSQIRGVEKERSKVDYSAT